MVLIMAMREISIKELTLNPFELIGEEWALITAGNQDGFNTMTISWGGMGVLWGKNVVFTFVRPQRYTLLFMQKNDYFTMSFYPKQFKSSLLLCGTKSGRDINKAEKAGLTPVFADQTVYFEQAELVFVCKKLAMAPMDPSGFIDNDIEQNYKDKDYHQMFAAEIVKVYTNSI